MTAKQRAINLRQIAVSAVNLEIETGIPAELTAGQCILESGWLGSAPGNNPFGMKAPAGATEFQVRETSEELTNVQIRRLIQSGMRVTDMGQAPNNRRRVSIQDRFTTFPSLDQAFTAYGRLLINGRYFAPRWQRYLAHRNLGQLLRDMSGADGQPPYFTSQSYLSSFDAITGQANVKAALAAARAANLPSAIGA